ncbi:hypothetical protein JOB18_028846 [Solea senegalensis]|uniref:Uncharacterized protein n=1 Tax=Solea senegalensis TaxID=28829 RepID=A0AAV6SH64_SOLSE|nr:hypothetical protein JOB18_028846 [Solea senegalensis]
MCEGSASVVCGLMIREREHKKGPGVGEDQAKRHNTAQLSFASVTRDNWKSDEALTSDSDRDTAMPLHLSRKAVTQEMKEPVL